MRIRAIDAAAPAALDRDALSELVRAEVEARRWTPRASVLHRLQRVLEALGPVAAEELAATCRQLERAGDLVAAEGGFLAATPLRAVPVADQRWRVFASAPAAVLDAILPGEWVERGLRRTRLAPAEAMRSAVEGASGLVVRPGEWAGLDRVPPADAAWIELLDRRLAAEPEPGGSCEDGEPLSWQAWVPGASGFGWRAGSKGRLWRARHPRFGWRRAWTGGSPPSQAAFVRLGADEEARTRFACARAEGSPMKMRYKDEGNAETLLLSIDGWLPRAEYRHLTLYGEAVEGGAWRLERSARDEVTRQLVARLGLLEEG